MPKSYSLNTIEVLEKSYYDKQGLLTEQKLIKQVNALFAKVAKKVAALGINTNYKGNKPFNFDDYPNAKKAVDKLMSDFANSLTVTIKSGVQESWNLAEAKNDALVGNIINPKFPKEITAKMYAHNKAAQNAFLDRADNGLKLSDRVWNITKQYKDELEGSLSIGIAQGKSARLIAKDITQYLQNPNSIKISKNAENENALLSKPGQGVYKSSLKNAMRVSRTETNMAYREADRLRRQENDFISGIKIEVSKTRACPICIALAGDYPKTFVFKGWHPQCRCHVLSILMPLDEFKKSEKAILEGKEPDPPSNTIKGLPSNFKAWYDKNKDKLKNYKTTPYFIADNKKFIKDRINK